MFGGHAAQQVDSGSLGAPHLRQAHNLPGGDLPGARRGAEVAAEGNCSNSSLDYDLGTAECAEVEPAPTARLGEGERKPTPPPGCSCCASLCRKSKCALLQAAASSQKCQAREKCRQSGRYGGKQIHSHISHFYPV